MKITRHLYFHPGERLFPIGGMMCGNTFIIRGREGRHTIIDPGPSVGPHLSIVKARMSFDGLRFGDIERIIISHAHPDHAQIAPQLAQSLKIPLCAGAAEQAVLEDPARVWTDEQDALGNFIEQVLPVPRSILDPFSLACFGPIKPFFGFTPLREGDALDLGGTPARIIETPGHRVGEIAVHLPEDKALVTGDLVHWERYDLPSLNFPTSDIDMAINSIEKILALDIAVLAPAHGEPIVGRRTIKRMLGYAIRRCMVMKKQAARAVLRDPGLSLATLGIELIGPYPQFLFHESRPIAYVVLKSIDAGKEFIARRSRSR